MKHGRIIGIDPGTNLLGYAILEVKGNKLRLMDCGTVSMKHLKTPYEKLRHIHESLTNILQSFQPNACAIEAPFYGQNIQSMLKLGRAQGVSIAAAMVQGIEVVEYSPKSVKQSVTGNGNASKHQVAAMCQSILGRTLAGMGEDATDALAVALCHHFKGGRSGGVKSHKSWQSFLDDNPDRIRKV